MGLLGDGGMETTVPSIVMPGTPGVKVCDPTTYWPSEFFVATIPAVLIKGG